jgi:hypothetical protein
MFRTPANTGEILNLQSACRIQKTELNESQFVFYVRLCAMKCNGLIGINRQSFPDLRSAAWTRDGLTSMKLPASCDAKYEDACKASEALQASFWQENRFILPVFAMRGSQNGSRLGFQSGCQFGIPRFLHIIRVVSMAQSLHPQ